MKILVTGTAGFIGYHLAKKLLQRGDEVIGLDNINENYVQSLQKDIEEIITLLTSIVKSSMENK